MAPGHLIAVAIVVGSVVGVATELDAWTFVAGAAAALSVAIVAYPGSTPFVCLVVVCGLASAVRAAAVREQALALEDGGLVQSHGPPPAPRLYFAEGTLTEDAVLMPDGTARLPMQVHTLRLGDTARPVRLRVQAYVGGAASSARVEDWTRGRRIRVPLTLRVPATLHNPGGAHPRIQRLTRGFDLSGSIKSALVADVQPGTWSSEAKATARKAIRRGLDRAFEGRSAEAKAVTAAILIGDRTSMSAETTDRLQAAGTYHVIAISGGNIAVLATAVMGLSRLLVRSPRWSAGIALVVIAVYGAIVGGEPSVTRAVTTACIYLAAITAGLAPSSSHVFAIAAAAVVAVDPLMTLAPGAWMSYGATLGILISAGWLVGRWRQWRGARGGLGWAVPMPAVALLAATVGAELILLPVSATLFARVGVAGLALNFVAIPAMVVVQLAGMTAVLLAPWWVAGAGLAARAGELGVWAITSSPRILDIAPWLSWRVAPPAAGWVFIYYVAVGTLALATRPRVKTAAAGAGLIGLACVLTSPDLARAGPPAHVLRVTMIDVGQGDATLLQFPGGRSLLVDAAPASQGFDAGDRVVAPALWALGVRQLDWLAITHPDLDHDGGAMAVAEAFDVGEVWEGVPVPSDLERAALRQEIYRRGGSWRQLRSGDRLEVSGVEIHVLHPDLPDWERQRPRNDDSLVLRVRYGRTEFLLTGDITASVESTLPTMEAPAFIRVLKLAHHGSRSSTSDAFLGVYAPVLALASAGQGNLFGHPAADVVRRLEKARVQVLRTDRDHAIMIESDGAALRVRTWAGGSWRVRAWWSS